MADFVTVDSLLMTLRPDVPVYALRPDLTEKLAADFVRQFPGDVLYAVKANPHPLHLAALHRGGIRHFDTASIVEIRQIRHLHPDGQCYFMHPVKAPEAIKEAALAHGLTHFVVDHPDELQKVMLNAPSKQTVIVIRLSMPRGRAIYDLGGKFGCSVAEAISLAKMAASAGLCVGLSFHVGSQCLDPSAYADALQRIGAVVQGSNIVPCLIDVGGGFPVAYQSTTPPDLGRYVAAITEGVAALRMPQPPRLLAEPGRALAAAGASLLVRVELRRDHQLYLNDGMYGGLSELRFAGLDCPMRVWRINGRAQLLAASTADFRFMGPTCDSSDILDGPFGLPHDIAAGDYIEIGLMGAYSLTLRSDFNGFSASKVVTVGS